MCVYTHTSPLKVWKIPYRVGKLVSSRIYNYKISFSVCVFLYNDSMYVLCNSMKIANRVKKAVKQRFFIYFFKFNKQ